MSEISILQISETAAALDWANLVRMAASALRAGVEPAAVADRLVSALAGGYGHVPYNSEALASDIEDLG